MPVSFQRILNSRLFKFIVGQDADGSPSEFLVHEEAIAQLSKQLHALTSSGASDNRAGSVTWTDVSKETFERFAQFAYTGDYSIPPPRERNVVNGVSTDPLSQNNQSGIQRGHSSHDADEAPVVEPQDSPLSRKHKKKKKSKAVSKALLPEPDSDLPAPQAVEEPLGEQHPAEPLPVKPEPEERLHIEPPSTELQPQSTESELESTPLAVRETHPEQLMPTLADDFHSLSYHLLAPRDNYRNTCDPASNFEKQRSYSNVLLSHASLYVLGDTQLVNSLKALALFKLHKTLCAFELGEENIADITDLARYVYSKEEGGFDDGSGGLRGLVCQYMAIHAVELSHDTKFMNLLAEGGQIVKDFLRFQLQRTH